MSENIGDLSITIRVNKETGELEVLKGQVTDTGKAIEDLGKSSTGSAAMMTELVGAMGKLASATAVLAFLKSAVTEAAAEQEAMRRLKAQMDALGLSFESNREKIESWTAAMVESAHIEDDEAVNALGKVIQRTGDLAASMKIVQLAQDIFIATGRDFNLTLESLSTAAGGSTRGLAQLQMQFGQQLASAHNAREAIQLLADNYGGAAAKAKGLSIAAADATISLKEMYSKVGNDLSPTLQFLADNVMKPLVGKFLEAEITVKTTATVIIASVVGATSVIWTSVKSIGSVISAFYRDDWKGFEEAIKNGFTEIKTSAKEQLNIVKTAMVEGGKESAAVWKKSGSEIKEALQDLNNIPVGPDKKETDAALSEMDRRLEELRRQEAIELADKMLMNEEKLAILDRYAEREIQVVIETKNQIGEEESKSAEKIAAIQDALALKKKQIEQAGLTNWKQGLNDWAKYNMDVNARVADIGKQSFDSLASAFGQATAKMLTSGKGFTQTFEALFRDLTSQVISQLTAMIVKAALLSALTGGTGTLFGVKLMAEGGRVYNPTYALIGEGGEPESVVPDSKAEDFARGVLAGKGTNSRSSFSSASSSKQDSSQGSSGVVVNLTANINVGSGVNDQQIRQLISALGTESADAITLALSMKNLADRNEGRAV